MSVNNDHYDFVVIGGGFYGCSIAAELRKIGKSVALLEQEDDVMQRASYTNQARIHQGYHYPRSILTALRSKINFDKFVIEFGECVYSDFDKYYAIGNKSSKVNTEQFRLFCQRIGAPLQQAPKPIRALFNSDLVEDVYKVREFAFDTIKLKQIMLELLDRVKVDVGLSCRVSSICQSGDYLDCNYSFQGDQKTIQAKYLLNCTYSGINQITQASNLEMVPLKHEMTEMVIIEMPDALKDSGFTLMDGPFFSIMPFPSRKLHTLSHVRYTPHFWWQDKVDKTLIDTQGYINQHQYVSNPPAKRHNIHMLKDAERYFPALKDCQCLDSMWEIKTILPQSEVDDSRPILFKRDSKQPNVVSVMGGKIDNIFDIKGKLQELVTTEWCN